MDYFACTFIIIFLVALLNLWSNLVDLDVKMRNSERRTDQLKKEMERKDTTTKQFLSTLLISGGVYNHSAYEIFESLEQKNPDFDLFFRTAYTDPVLRTPSPCEATIYARTHSTDTMEFENAALVLCWFITNNTEYIWALTKAPVYDTGAHGLFNAIRSTFHIQ